MMLRSPSRRAALLTAALLVMAGLLLYGKHQGRKEQIGHMEERLERLDSGNRRARSFTPAGVAQLRRRLDEYAARIARLEKLIPRSEEVPALLESLAWEARRSGLGDLAFIRPGAVEPGLFYTRQSYELSVVGGYHETARFLTAIASLPRIVTPVELEMTASPGVGADEDARVSAHFWIETYVRPPGETEAQLAAGDASSPEVAR